MDEEVINDLYSRAVSKGYRKDRDQFVNLLHTDEEVINDMYSYVQSKGYKKSIDDFSTLVGKNQVEQPVEQSPQEVEQPKKKDFGFTNSSASLVSIENQIPEQQVDVSQELERNPFISFGKKFAETFQMMEGAFSAKGAGRIQSLASDQANKLESIKDIPDEEIIKMPNIVDPRRGETEYKAGDYKKMMAERVVSGNKAAEAALEFAIKNQMNLAESDVISSLTQIKDGYDLVNFITASVGQAAAQIPLAVLSGGASSYAMESGNIYLDVVREIAEKEGITPIEVIKQGKDAKALAEIGGALSGALELVGAKKVMEIFGVENIKKDLRKKGMKIFINSQIEGATEVGQELITGSVKGLANEGRLRIPGITESLDAYAMGMFGAAGIQSPSLLTGNKKEVKPVILKGKTKQHGFVDDGSGKMELSKDNLTIEEAEIVVEDIKSKYPSVDATVKEVGDAYTVETEKTKIRQLNDGDSNLDFIETEDGLEYTEDGLDEKSANGIVNKLATKYPNIEFSLVDNTPGDTYALADFKVVGKPKNTPKSEYKVGDKEVPKEMVSVKIESAENLDELKEVSIVNDPELQSALDGKLGQLSKPVEEVKTEEIPVVEPENVPLINEGNKSEVVENQEIKPTENVSIQEQPTIEEPRGEKPTVVENVSEKPTVEGTDTKVQVEKVFTIRNGESVEATVVKEGKGTKSVKFDDDTQGFRVDSEIFQTKEQAESKIKQDEKLQQTETKTETKEVKPKPKKNETKEVRLPKTEAKSEEVKKADQPKRLFHSSVKGIESIREGSVISELGIHLGNKEVADKVGEAKGAVTREYEIDIKNPIRVNDFARWEAFTVSRKLKNEGVISEKEYEKVNKQTGNDKERELIKILKSKGYDGFVYENYFEGGGDSYVVFDKNQVKEVKNEPTTDTKPAPKTIAETDVSRLGETETDSGKTGEGNKGVEGEKVTFSVFGEQITGTKQGEFIIAEDGTKYRASNVKDANPIEAQKKKVKAIIADLKAQIKEDKSGIMFDFRAKAEADIKFYETLVDLVNNYVRLKGMQISEAIKEIEANLGKKLGKANTDFLIEIGKEFKKKPLSTEKQIKQSTESKPSSHTRNTVVNDYAELKRSLRERAKAAREGAKFGKAEFQKMKSDMISFIELELKDIPVNEFTKNEIKLILGKIKSAKTEYTVNSSIDKIFDILAKAANRSRIKGVKAKQETARANIKSGKIGVVKTEGGIDEILRINPMIVPKQVFESFQSIITELGERKSVLTPRMKTKLISDIDDILKAVDEQNSKISELSELYKNADKVEVKDKKAPNGKRVSYSATVDAMLQKGDINQEDAQLMRDRRSDILNQDSEFEGKSEQELEAEKQDAIADVLDLKIFLPKQGGLFTEAENNIIRTFNSITKADLGILPVAKIKQIAGLIGNLSNNYIPHLAFKVSTEINGNRGGIAVMKTVGKYKGNWIEWISRSKAAFKNTLAGQKVTSTIQEKMARTGLYGIDMMLGNFTNSEVVRNTFWKLAQPIEQKNIEYNDIVSRLSKLLDKIPDANQWKEMSLISMIQLQKQHLADNFHPDTKAWLDKTGEDGIYSTKAYNALVKIFEENSTDGVFDIKKAESKLSNEAKALYSEIIKIQNTELMEKAAYGSTVVRGNMVPIVTEYTPTPAKYKTGTDKSQKEMDDLTNRFLNPSTKAGTFNAKTGQAHPISFDPIENLLWSARNTLIDFHMTPAVREVNETFKMMHKLAKTETEKEVVHGMQIMYDNVKRVVLTNDIANNSLPARIGKYIERKAYQAVLGGITRPFVDFTSNSIYVAIQKPTEGKLGMEMMKKYNKDILSRVAKNAKSVELVRLYGNSGLTSMNVSLKDKKSIKPIRGERNWMEKALDTSKVLDVEAFIDGLATQSVSRPDQIVSQVLFNGVLATSFKNSTGKDLDIEKLADNDQDYIQENFKAIEDSAFEADAEVQEAFSSSNEFLGIQRNVKMPSKGVFDAWWSGFNGFMNQFTVGEYLTSLRAINAMMGNGKLTRGQGMRLLAAQTARLAWYSTLIRVVPTLVTGGILYAWYGDDEEEKKKEEKDWSERAKNELSRQITQVLFTLVVQRNLGNFAKIPSDIGMEALNEKYGEGITWSGTYNRYTDAIAFPITNTNSENMATDIALRTLGPYGPLGKSFFELGKNYHLYNQSGKKKKEEYSDKMAMNGFQILGNLGFVPYYRDVNNVVKQSVYESSKRAKKEE